MDYFRKIYDRIPRYGRLMRRRGEKVLGNVVLDSSVTYYSIMLKGDHKKLFESSTFYIVLTEDGLKEAIHRGEVNKSYAPPELFGRYTGIKHVENAGRSKNTFDCIFLRVYKFTRGGGVEELPIVLSERQFRRAIVRAKTRPELVVRKKWWHEIYYGLFSKILKVAND